MGGDIGNPRIEIRLGRDFVDLLDAAEDALECERDRNDTALVNLLLAADGVGVGPEYSLLGDRGDPGDAAGDLLRAWTALLPACRCCSSGGFCVGDFRGA
jgi:hypothetical protein